MATNNRRPQSKKRVNVKDIPKVRDENFLSIYCNATNFLASSHDIQILMAQLEMGPNQTPILRERSSVTMSPSHFKAFAQAVNQQLADWEKDHGEIRLPAQEPISAKPQR